MKRVLLIVVAVVSGAAWGFAGEIAASPGDVAKLQGKWEGRAGAAREIQVTLDVAGSTVDVLVLTPQGLKIRARGEIRLDETTSPRSLDWIKFSCNDSQELPEISGIYKLDGDGFTICNGGFNGARPIDFQAGDGPLADVLVFHRAETASLADAKH